MGNDTTVIIPTLGARPRELERAIASVTSQAHARAIPLVVVNGQRYDVDLVAGLKRRKDLRCVQLEAAGVSNARLEGRRLVDTPYFAFLDDDDELLPDALEQRLAAFVETSSDVVVTNGYRESEHGRQIIFPRFDHHPDDPARALLEENWLASAGGFYRTDKIEPKLLQDLPDYLEMTYLAFLLAHRSQIVRLNQPTFVVHAGAAEQASESFAYLLSSPDVLQRMQSITSRKDLKSRLGCRRANALHQASETALRYRKLGSAWRLHLQSLIVGDGIKYLPYTRHIVLGRSRT
ncbi:MAG: glycosyltransferase [Pseudomonadota bacterium]